MTRQQIIDKAVDFAIAVAKDSSHGYDQGNRWGPDYDCSSLVITAYQEAGVPVKTRGATYTGNMRSVFMSCGFVDVLGKVNVYTGAGLKKGDVLLNQAAHTELYIGDGKCVGAHINERGGVTGGQTGDQTGREISIGPYYNSPWDCILRYMGDGNDEPEKEPEKQPEVNYGTCTVTLPILKQGMTGYVVAGVQALLIQRGFKCGWWGADGDFGSATTEAVKSFQQKNKLTVDGIVGAKTWAVLLGGRNN